MPAGQLLELRNVVGIRQETHVEHQVAIRWHAMPVPEAVDIDPYAALVAAAAEFLPDYFAQLVHVELGSVNDVIRHAADRRQQLALRPEAFLHRPLGTQRMRTPRLAESARQRAIVGLEKYQRGRSALAQPLEQGGELHQLLALADIDHQRLTPYV